MLLWKLILWFYWLSLLKPHITCGWFLGGNFNTKRGLWIYSPIPQEQWLVPWITSGDVCIVMRHSWKMQAYPLTLRSVPGPIQQGTHWVLCLLSGCQMSWAIIILMPAVEQLLLHTEKQRVVAADESLIYWLYVGNLGYGWSSVVLGFNKQFTPKLKFSNNLPTHHPCWWEVGWGFVQQ